MLRFTNKIEAIKASREMAVGVRIVYNEQTGRYEILSGAGLKEHKDFVEAVMAYGARDAIERMRSILRKADADLEAFANPPQY